MEGGIDSKALLEFIEFQVFPSQNRYEASVCWRNRSETITSGPLAQLLRHTDKVKILHSNGSDANFRFQPPKTVGNIRWFTKSTLLRFLHIVASSNILNSTSAVLNEISQLEEARRFHISIYAKGPHPTSPNGATDSSYSKDTTSTTETDTVSSDATRNELLRAIDLRLTALRGGLSDALDKAAGAVCSPEDIIDVEKFSHHFGATELRNILRKLIEMNQGNQTEEFLSNEESLSKNDIENHTVAVADDYRTSEVSLSETPVKYGVSPAKAAQVERQSSSESEESSISSEEDQPSAERSRTPIRCASPRRSASPMRRIQIGRSGSRRSTPLTIKSLTHFPARDRIASHKDGAGDSTDEEGSEKPSRKSDYNIKRMSVQDAVKLFESKQKEQTIDIQKAKSLLNASIGASKSVLRRWSSGMGESPKCPSDTTSDKSTATGLNTLDGGEIGMNSPEAKEEPDLPSNGHLAEPLDENMELNSSGKRFSLEGMQEGACPTSTADVDEKIAASAEWGRQKEAELNQLLMKMMETKPVKYQNPASGSTKNQKIPSEQRGGFYDHYKEKRDMKLRGETAGKRAEKEKQFRAMQQILDERKAAMASKISSTTAGRENVKKPQKALKNASQPAKTKMDTSKPAVKKASQRTSPLPATRKSWPSTPTPRGSGTSPSTTPGGVTSVGSTTTRRRSQPMPSAPRSSPKLDVSQLRPKPAKTSPAEVKKNSGNSNDKKQRTMAKIGKATETKLQSGSADPASSAKPSLYSKVTKKSSVVPLEQKPFLKKGSRVGPGVTPTTKSKAPQPEGSLRKSGDLILAKENEIVPDPSDSVIEQLETDVEALKVHLDSSSETLVQTPLECEHAKFPDQVLPVIGDNSQRIAESPLKTEAEDETLISPAAWVEIEEQGHQPIPCNNSLSQVESPINFEPVKISSPRVRHSLSQMLLEENNEPDVIEWGNAENPPSLIYQKDSPKGLKRLLKFARKSKTDANSTGWSTPSVFSEGEDDAEESKTLNKKNAENLLKKATLRAKYEGHQKNEHETYEENPATREPSAQPNPSRFTSQTLSQKLREGHASASMTTTKASRSFFSLSAFKSGR